MTSSALPPTESGDAAAPEPAGNPPRLAELASEDADLSLQQSPPARRRVPRWLAVAPLLGAAALVGWLWRGAPVERSLLLDLGAQAQAVLELELSCLDDQGLSAGSRLRFESGAPGLVRQEVSTAGHELTCELTLRSANASRTLQRTVQLQSEEVRLPLAKEVASLAAAPR